MSRILVFERMNRLDEQISSYLIQEFEKDEIKIIYKVDDVPQQDIIDAIMWCDTIVFQSIFDTTFENGIETFKKMVHLFFLEAKLRKPVHIIHSTGRLLSFLNQTLNSDTISEIAVILKSGLEIYNVHFNEYENPANNKKTYFRESNIYKFATVKLWWCEKHAVIWDEQPYYLPELISNNNLYRFKPKFVEIVEENKFVQTVEENKYSNLTKSELNILNEILFEKYEQINDLIEDLNNTKENALFDAEEKESLMKEHNKRIDLLKKLNCNNLK